MLGLLANQPGKQRNLVAARFGNISLMADEDEPIKQGNGNLRPSHLFDVKSRTGFSGSPVFVYRTMYGDMRGALSQGEREIIHHRASIERSVRGVLLSEYYDTKIEEEIRDNTFLMLLGIHSSQLRDIVKVKKIERSEDGGEVVICEDVDGAPGESVRAGDKLLIPNSVTVVVPGWRILTLLNEQPLAFQRMSRDRSDMEAEEEENPPEPEGVEPTAPRHAGESGDVSVK